MRSLLYSRYEHPGLGDDNAHDPFMQADMTLARRVGETLARHFPGHPFYVTAQHKQGIVTIDLPGITAGTNQCMIVRIAELANDPALNLCVRMAGELLERYRLPRSGFSGTAWEEALARRPIGAHNVPE